MAEHKRRSWRNQYLLDALWAAETKIMHRDGDSEAQPPAPGEEERIEIEIQRYAANPATGGRAEVTIRRLR